MKMIKTSYGYAIEDAQLMFTNFSGHPDKYSDGGKRSFCVRIDTKDIANSLRSEGWNVKELAPLRDGDEPVYYLSVKLTFDSRRPPHVYLHGEGTSMEHWSCICIEIDASNANLLDEIDIATADMVIRAYEWEPGKISAWLQELHVVQAEDFFASKYRNDPADTFPTEDDDDSLPF